MFRLSMYKKAGGKHKKKKAQICRSIIKAQDVVTLNL